MCFYECFTRVSSYMYTVRLLSCKYCKSSAYQKIGISIEKCIWYFATHGSFFWSLGRHINKLEPTAKAESSHKTSTMYHSYERTKLESCKKRCIWCEKPLAPFVYFASLVYWCHKESDILYVNYLVFKYIPNVFVWSHSVYSMKIVNIIREASHHTTLTVFYVFGKCENVCIFSIIYRNSKQHRQLICYLMKYKGKIILHSQYHRWWWYQWPWCWSSSPRVYMYWFDGSNVLNADGRYVWYGGKCFACLHILAKTCYWYQQLSLPLRFTSSIDLNLHFEHSNPLHVVFIFSEGNDWTPW